MRDELDRFFTSRDDVDTALKTIDIEEFDCILEPSAGSGAFSDKIPGCIAIDICPQNDTIQEQDFLEMTLEDLPKHTKLLIIGNPPFGNRGKMAKNFISHAISLRPHTIAFVLPDTFRKYSNQTVFPDTWKLRTIQKLTGEFSLLGEAIFIPCSFFVWTAEGKRDLRDTKAPIPDEFAIVGRGSKEADFVVSGNSGKIKNLADITNPKAEHYIKVNDGYSVDEIRKQLSEIKYAFVSSVNGGVAWINKNDIYKAWAEQKPQETEKEPRLIQ